MYMCVVCVHVCSVTVFTYMCVVCVHVCSVTVFTYIHTCVVYIHVHMQYKIEQCSLWVYNPQS